MKLPSRNVMLFNGGAGALMLVGVGAILQSVFVQPEKAPCAARYDIGTVLGVTDDEGRPLTPGAMQSRLGVDEWGVAEHLSIAPVKGAPQTMALRVALPKGAGGEGRAGQGRAGQGRGGIGFRWQPGYLSESSSVCLLYDVKLAKDFNFHRGGRLPGLFGGLQGVGGGETGGTEDSFAVHIGWGNKGAGAIKLTGAGSEKGTALTFGYGKFSLDRGRWVRLEQEVVLNDPGRKDGELRVWIDGKLVLDRTNIPFRKTAGGRIAGVQANTHYVGSSRTSGARKDTEILLTPFNVRWQ